MRPVGLQAGATAEPRFLNEMRSKSVTYVLAHSRPVCRTGPRGINLDENEASEALGGAIFADTFFRATVGLFIVFFLQEVFCILPLSPVDSGLFVTRESLMGKNQQIQNDTGM